MRSTDRQGIPASLAPALLFSTSDPATAEKLGEPLLGRHRLATRDRGFCATLHAAVIGAVTLGYLHVTTPVELHLDATAARFLVLEPAAGAIQVRVGGRELVAGAERAVVLQPGRPASLALAAGATSLLIGIERHALLIHLCRILDRAIDDPLVFDDVLDLATAPASRWSVAVEMLHAELTCAGSLLRSGIGVAPLQEFLMSALLYGHRSTYSRALCQPGPATESRTVATAKAFIEAHLRDRLTVASVASAAGVSARTLQAGFRAELRTTPTCYIRSRRLDRVRIDLVDVAVDAVTVTDIATRWGFTHLGRFATDYRDRFGETPSQTLHRRTWRAKP